ncbi:MAG: DUF190 domain-containing protein [Anaerolineales bacterium]|nr:DUF190 domain-containing protein [Anaerolineales bacterium]
MRIVGPGKRLTVYFGETDQWQGRALYKVLLETLKREGIAGATVTRAVAGFGAHSRIRTASIESLSTDLPMILEAVDRPGTIEKALSVIGPMIREGLITVEDLSIERYTHRHLHPIPGDRPVREVMTADVVAVGPEAPIADVMDLLIGQRFKSVPVVDTERKVLGIVSDGALIARGGVQYRLSMAERLDRATLAGGLDELRKSGSTARDVMRTPVVTIPDSTSLAHASSLMVRQKLQRLPVVDKDGRLAGMLSRVDVLRTVVENRPPAHAPVVRPGPAQTVGEIMDPDVPVVPPDAGLADIVEKMVSSDLKRVIVIDAEGRAAGIINDGDLVARVEAGARQGLLDRLMRRSKDAELPNATAAELMTPSVLTGPEDTPVAEAIAKMLEQKRKRFVVVDDAGKPIGIVDRQMLLHAVAGGE